jgi:hypothetical protein
MASVSLRWFRAALLTIGGGGHSLQARDPVAFSQPCDFTAPPAPV